MTVVTRTEVRSEETLRVVAGKKSRRPSTAPWLVVAVLGVVAFFGQGFARTSLDRNAFELAELNKSIAVEEALNLELTLKIARLESPTRIGPLAEQLGMIVPQTTHQLLADLDGPPPAFARSATECTHQ